MHRLSLSALLAAAAAVGACRQQPAADTNAAQEPVLNLPSVAKPQPAMDRAALLAAVTVAASAAAAGTALPESVRSLDGRQFEIRIRFGCRGPAADLAGRWLGWSFDPEERRIRVRAMPTISGSELPAERMRDKRIEAVEGFWIPRPWLLAPVCPATPAAVRRVSSKEQSQAETRTAEGADEPAAARVEEPMPPAPRIGIAQFFTREDPRSRRRDMRPYEAGHTLPDGQALSSQGYNLVLSGRLRALPEGGVIQCLSHSADSPPECIVSAEFQRVWIEKPDTREVIAEWGTG